MDKLTKRDTKGFLTVANIGEKQTLDILYWLLVKREDCWIGNGRRWKTKGIIHNSTVYKGTISYGIVYCIWWGESLRKGDRREGEKSKEAS